MLTNKRAISLQSVKDVRMCTHCNLQRPHARKHAQNGAQLRPPRAYMIDQVGDFPLSFFNPQGSVGLERGDARAVVTPVLQPFEPINEDGKSGLGAQITNDSAHDVECRDLLP